MARIGALTLDSNPDDVAEAIVGESIRRGHSRDETIAELSTAIQESSLNPRAHNPAGPWDGVYQQDGSYPGRFDANTQITGFLDRLDAKRSSPGASADPWLNIFWLQQRPGEPSAQQAFNNGRRAYLDEIRRHIGRATDYYNRFAGGAPTEVPVVPRPEFHEINVIGERRISDQCESRAGTTVDLFLLHTSEGADGEGLIAFMEGKGERSYHYIVSLDGRTVWDLVDTDLAAWSAGNANHRSINAVIGGSRGAWSRQEWIDRARNAIRVMAWLAVADCAKYGIEPRVLVPDPADTTVYHGDPPGISDHKFVTYRLGWGTHWDMGPEFGPSIGFPWDLFAADVREFSGQGPNTQIGDVTLSGDDAALVVASARKILASDMPGNRWPSRCMFGDADIPVIDGVDDTVGMLLNTEANAWNVVRIVGALVGVESDMKAVEDAAAGRFPAGSYIHTNEWLKVRAVEFAKRLEPLCGLLRPEALSPPTKKPDPKKRVNP